jgi:hypothetical protein
MRLVAGNGGYYQYVNERAGEVGRNAHCIRYLLGELDDDFDTVMEPFGGVGVFGTVIQGVCKPSSHKLFDIDEDCLVQLQNAFEDRPGVEVAEGDAQETIGSEPADFYMLDTPFYTALRHEQWREAWERMFALKPKAVIWMDGASFGMQWHAARYAELMSYPILNNEDYARATSFFIHTRYGYAVRAATVSRGCFYFAVTEGPVSDFPLAKFSTKGRGLLFPGDKPVAPDPPEIRYLLA